MKGVGQKKIEKEGEKLGREGLATSAGQCGDRLWWYDQSLRGETCALNRKFLTFAIPKNYFPFAEFWFEAVL